MNEKEAREIVTVEGWQNKYSERSYYQAKGYIEAIEKAKGLEEAARLTVDHIGPWIENRGAGKFEPGMITCLDKLRLALAKWEKEK